MSMHAFHSWIRRVRLLPGRLRPGWTGGLAALALLAAGCRPASTPEPEVAAVVGQSRITVAELEAEIARLPAGDGAPDARRQRALDALVDEVGQFEQARSAGFDGSPELQRRWRQLVVREWRERALSGSETNTVSEAELRAWYEANLDRFRVPGRVRAGLIALKVHARAEASRREAAREVLNEARRAIVGAADPEAAFQRIARERSEDAGTRFRGGDTGWLALGPAPLRWPEEVTAELGRLSDPGSVSPVLETPTGLYLVAVWEREAPGTKPFEQVREGLVHPARLAREERLAREFAAAAREAAGVRIHADAVARARVPAPPPSLAKLTPPSLPKSDSPSVNQP